jgi:hypothetical protein
MPQIAFTCTKQQIEDGTYSIDDLKHFTLNSGVTVIIKRYAIIQNGKINYFH